MLHYIYINQLALFIVTWNLNMFKKTKYVNLKAFRHLDKKAKATCISREHCYASRIILFNNLKL